LNRPAYSLIDALVFHRENYAFRKRFDDKMPFYQTQLMVFFVRFCKWIGLSKLIALGVQAWFKRKDLTDLSIVCFIFSHNHHIVYEEFSQLDLTYPYIDFTFSKTYVNDSNNMLHIPSYMLFLSALSNAGRFLSSIDENKDDLIQLKNRVKLFKLAGYEYSFNRILPHVKVAVKYNDHIFNNMLLFDCCQQHQVRTVYIQHAPVTELMPPLHHDLNVLFSADSREKYKVLDASKEVFEFVDVRLLKSKEFIKQSNPREDYILIATNLLDDLNLIYELIHHLRINYTIYLRPHPRDKRSLDVWNNYPNVHIRRHTNIWEDMNDCSIVICNQSGVPLEAIYYNRLVYKAAFLSDPLDAYSFVANGLLTKEYNNMDEMIRAIQNREVAYDQKKLPYYIGDVVNYRHLAKQLKSKINALLEN
jgi:hypothetical protein